MLFSLNSRSQQNADKVVVVHGVSFIDVCNGLLDQGYSIEKKDNDLQTVRTEAKAFPKYFNCSYILNIRVKDSVAFITGTFNSTMSNLFKNEPIENVVNRKGVQQVKSLSGYPLTLMQQFARNIKPGKEITYSK